MKKISGASIILTENCNLECTYCYEKNKQCEYMTLDVALEAIDFLIKNREDQNKPIFIMWFGGEPMLNFAVLKKSVEYAYEKIPDLRSTIVTNGTICNNSIIEMFAKHPKMKLQLSWDGMPEFQNTNRGLSEVFERNIKKWVSLENDIDIHVQITPNMVSKLSENIAYIVERFPKAKIILRPIAEMPGWDSKDILKILYEQLLKIFSKHGDKIDKVSKCINNSIEAGTCGAGKNFASITPAGEIYACHRFYFNSNKKFIVGTLKDGFISNAMIEALENYKPKNIIGCATCDAYESCDRCIAANYESTADFLVPNTKACQVNKCMFFAVFEYARNKFPWLLATPEIAVYMPINVPNNVALKVFIEEEILPSIKNLAIKVKQLEFKCYQNNKYIEFIESRLHSK